MIGMYIIAGRLHGVRHSHARILHDVHRGKSLATQTQKRDQCCTLAAKLAAIVEKRRASAKLRFRLSHIEVGHY